MKTIILAAGMSRRLGELTKEKPKCLLQAGNETILGRIIRICAQVGLNDIVIVTGHGAQYVDTKLKEVATANWATQLKVRLVYNANYETINNCYSLLVGLPEKDESILVINSDDVFDSRILQGIATEGPSRLVIDNVKKLTDESMKVQMDGDCICRIGKFLDISMSIGEYIGLTKLASKDIPLLRDSLRDVVDNNPDEFYENAFDLMFKRTKVYPWFTNGLKWTEVDTPEDLDFAKSLVQKGALQ